MEPYPARGGYSTGLSCAWSVTDMGRDGGVGCGRRVATLRVGALALAWLVGASSSWSALAGPREVIDAVVGVRAEVPADARTADTLGRERSGTGIAIDNAGLVLTVGYIVLEAAAVDLYDARGERVPAEVVAYDHETGFGLVRAAEPLQGVQAVPLGKSAEVRVGDPLLVLSRLGPLQVQQARLVDRREYAGYWEYLLPDALLTTPPHPAFAGAALIDAQGQLVGVGSLTIPDAAGAEIASPGNLFVPVDALGPIMGDLLSQGRREGAGRPWLGLYAREHAGRVVVTGVADGSPAAAAGVAPGDVLLSVGAKPIAGLSGLYREIWSLGDAGVRVPLKVLRGPRTVDLDVGSIDRMRWLRLRQSY